jgi:predicted deacylase
MTQSTRSATTTAGSLSVAGLRAAPGERTTGYASVELGDRVVRVPVILVKGARPGPRFGVTAGIHGAEYVSIAALSRVAMSIDPERLTGSLVAVPIANPAAFAARSVYLNALDGRNLNRIFPGAEAGLPGDRLADWLLRTIILPSDRYLDMHCGDMNEALASFTGWEETGRPEVDAVSRSMADAYGLDYVVLGSLPGSTTTAAAMAGIPAVLGEVGGQGLWPAADVDRHAAGFVRALAAGGVLPDVDPTPPAPSRYLGHDTWLRSEVDGCFHPTVSVGAEVSAGQVVGEVRDIFGAVRRTVEAPIDGVVLFLVTSLAMNEGDPLLAIGA